MNLLQRICTSSLSRFIVVGILNTILGMSLMYGAYHFLQFGYWGASAFSYVLASIFSFYANKSFTFASRGNTAESAIKFAVNIAFCYTVAYAMAKPMVFWLFELAKMNVSISIVEQIAMFVGMCIFTGLNYFGQRFFVFRQSS